MRKEYESYHLAVKIKDSLGEKIETHIREKNISRKSDFYKIIVELGIAAYESEDLKTNILSKEGITEILNKIGSKLTAKQWEELSELCHKKSKFYGLEITH